MNIYNNIVYEIENFLTKDQHDALIKIIQNASEDQWPNVIQNEFVEEDTQWGGKILFLQKDQDPESNETEILTSSIYDLISKLFIGYNRINPISAIQRYLPDSGMGQHVDDGFDKQVKFGVVIYINDDYEGGEIYYPTIDLKIKPKANSMIIHPANLPHLVENVRGENIRYILSTFISGDTVTLDKEVANAI